MSTPQYIKFKGATYRLASPTPVVTASSIKKKHESLELDMRALKRAVLEPVINAQNFIQHDLDSFRLSERQEEYAEGIYALPAKYGKNLKDLVSKLEQVKLSYIDMLNVMNRDRSFDGYPPLK